MDRIKALLVALTALTFAASPLFVPGFAGFDPAQFPVPQADPPVQPAGWAFGIWGLIYLWLLVHAGFGLLARAMDPAWDRPRWPLVATLGLGTFWLAIATGSPVWASVAIFAMLGLSLGAVARAPRADRWLAAAPLSLLAGWLTAAAFVSLAVTAAGYGVLMGGLAWAVAGITGALVVGLAVLLVLRPHPTYALALGWGLLGIAAANWDRHWSLALFAAFGALASLAAMARSYRPRRPPQPAPGRPHSPD